MADYTVIPDIEYAEGKPVKGVTGIAMRDNLVAVTQGALGTPKIQAAALDPTVLEGTLNNLNKIVILAFGTYASGTYSFPNSHVWDDFELISVVGSAVTNQFVGAIYTREIFSVMPGGGRLYATYGTDFSSIQRVSTTQFAVTTNTHIIKQVTGWLR